MEIIPAINCFDKECFLKKIEVVRSFLKDINWLQIDISDGIFSPVKSFYDLELLKKIKKDLNLKIEIHLMVENLEFYLKEFLFADRLVIHLETLEKKDFLFSKILELSAENNFQIMLALKKDTDISKLENYLDSIDFVQFLAVEPGFSGQNFDESILEKIKDFHELYPDILIEVDGGINLENIKKIKEVGVDFFVVGSFIFDHEKPKEQYNRLKEEILLPLINKK